MRCCRLPIVLLALSSLTGSAALAAEHPPPPQETAVGPGPVASSVAVAAPAPASSPTVAEREEELATRVLHLVDLLDLRRLVSGFDDPVARARIDLARVEGAVRELEPARRERLLLGVIDLRFRLRDYDEATRPTPPSDPTTAERLDALLESSLDLAAQLGALLEAPAPTAPSPTAAGPTVSASATGSTCADAIPIGNGTFSGTTVGAGRDGSSSCESSSSTSNDFWYLYTPPVTGFADIELTNLNAVLSLHAGCPGTASNELACRSTFGIPGFARLFRSMSAGEPVYVRVSGIFESGPFVLTTASAGAVSGVVTDDVTGAPLAGAEVRLVTDDNTFGFSALTAEDGSYRLDTPGGTVHVATNSDYLDEVWDGFPCDVFCDLSIGTPIEVTSGTTVQGIDFALTPLGSIAGRVTDAVTGDPLSGVVVDVVDGSQFLSGVALTAPDGTYQVGGLRPGSYFVRTSSSMLDEEFDGVICERGLCDLTAGTAVPVIEGSTTTGIDFALHPGAKIAGQVVDAVTRTPIGGLRIAVVDAQGVRRGGTLTLSDGTYSVDQLPPGSFFIRTAGNLLYVDQLYDGVRCEPVCDPTIGTPVPATGDLTTSGIDFLLTPFGKIEGTITDGVTGAALPAVQVLIFGSNGEFITVAFSLLDGSYRVETLPTGTYFAVATDSSYIDVLWDDVSCEPSCDPVSGTPLAVTEGSVTANVDFALTQHGTITGTILDASTSGPAAGVPVIVFNSDGFHVLLLTTLADGTYESPPLLSGTYFVTAGLSSVFSPLQSDRDLYAGDLWNGHPCFPSCDVTSGDPISVTDGAETSGIDFTLSPRGEITGTVTDAVDGTPIGFPVVEAYGADGLLASDSFFGTSTGTYRIRVAAGSYRVVARDNFHLDQLYPGILCQGPCDLATGTAVTVAAGATTSGIDFALDRFGALEGTVTEIGSGDPVSSFVHVFDATGAQLAASFNDLDGSYRFLAVLPGTYFVKAEPPVFTDEPFRPQLWQGIFCDPTCDPTTGTPITIAANATASNIDFVVALDASVAGRVASVVSGDGVGGVTVDLFNGGGTRLTSVLTDDQGSWLMPRVRPGTYFVRTRSVLFSDQLWRDLPCQPGCDPTTGTPIAVGSGQAVSGIDFSLAGCDSPQVRTVSHFTFLTSQAVEACDTLTADPDVHVDGGADVVFRAGHTIVLGDGFSVGSGASFRAEIRPELLLP